MLVPLFITLCIFMMTESTTGINSRGVTPLDTWSFDKLISKFDATIVKFDIAYPYGKKHEEFGKLGAAGRTSSKLLVAEVGVKDYGDMDNMDLAERFNVNKDDFPVVKLFKKTGEDVIDFDGEFTADNLKTFIRKNSNAYIGLQDCLETFDRLADEFMKSTDQKHKQALLQAAEDEWDKITNPSDRRSAEVYVKVMRKLIEKGSEFVSQEKARVKGLMEGKISPEKKEQMQGKLNILQSFDHDEL
ncbi:endoplasmic reticulum protein 29-like protein wbl [Oratosquilla oratoria]|uniref:endoplasmic reticulum protein 29-like protein wbl n=1 Tax=Oratosquilla oratoria TaxID=337810 RepID=UPI003F77415A